MTGIPSRLKHRSGLCQLLLQHQHFLLLGVDLRLLLTLELTKSSSQPTKAQNPLGVTTAESHHRVMIMEVMGRDAGWIALQTAIAGGAEICLIPEIPYDVDKILKKINKRYHKGRGFANIVIAEGANPVGGTVVGKDAKDEGDPHIKLGGIGVFLRQQLEEKGCQAQIRTTILGHVQRGGTPIAFDRLLATAMGVHAFDMVVGKEYGRMVSYHNNRMESVTLLEATKEYKVLKPDDYLLRTARRMGVSFGD